MTDSLARMPSLTHLSTVVELDLTTDLDPGLLLAALALALLGCVLLAVGIVRWLRLPGNVDRASRRLVWAGGSVALVGAAWFAAMVYL